MDKYRPETLGDVEAFSYGFDYGRNTPVFVSTETKFGSGFFLGHPGRYYPDNQVEDRGKSITHFTKGY